MPKTKPRPPTIEPESSEGNARGHTPPLTLGAEPDRLLTVEQVRQFLVVSEWLVRRLIKDGLLPAVTIGTITRIRVGDLRAFIAARHGLAEPEPPRRRAKPPKAEARHGRRRAIKGNAAQAGEGR